jgi:hypothetical protein
MDLNGSTMSTSHKTARFCEDLRIRHRHLGAILKRSEVCRCCYLILANPGARIAGPERVRQWLGILKVRFAVRFSRSTWAMIQTLPSRLANARAAATQWSLFVPCRASGATRTAELSLPLVQQRVHGSRGRRLMRDAYDVLAGRNEPRHGVGPQGDFANEGRAIAKAHPSGSLPEAACSQQGLVRSNVWRMIVATSAERCDEAPSPLQNGSRQVSLSGWSLSACT